MIREKDPEYCHSEFESQRGYDDNCFVSMLVIIILIIII